MKTFVVTKYISIGVSSIGKISGNVGHCSKQKTPTACINNDFAVI
jgi:hypothetical protein